MAVETHDDPLYSETGTWFRFSAEEVAERCDGLNLQTTGAYTLGARLFLTANNFQSESNQERFLDSFNEVAESTQALLTLTTPANTLDDWIAAGRAYMRAQLAAGLLGLRMHPVSQALQEYPQMAGIRAELARLLPVPAPGKLQMLVRLGRTEPPALSPRRPLAAMLT
jgi:hypothetical protein